MRIEQAKVAPNIRMRLVVAHWGYFQMDELLRLTQAPVHHFKRWSFSDDIGLFGDDPQLMFASLQANQGNMVAENRVLQKKAP